MSKTEVIKKDEEKEHLDEVSRIHRMYEQTISTLRKDLEYASKECMERSKQKIDRNYS